MKKIGIDARLYFQTGVGTYIRNLIYHLKKIVPKNLFFYLYVMKNDSSKINFNHPQFIKKEVSDYWHSFSEQISFWLKLRKDNLDLMHFTYFSYPILYQKPFIATVHDITPLIFKTGKASTKSPFIYQIKHFFFRLILASQIKNSLAIITPSKTVKKQLIDIYGLKYQGKIFPIYEGINNELKKIKENKILSKQFTQPFFIYVGNFYPHKNVERLIYAFSKINEKIELILIGPNDFFAKKIFQLINKLNLKERVILYTPKKISDLVYFYKHALALINPSLSEGFGLPLIEAAYFNCPIIASNIDVFKEILDNHYLAFNPYDIDDIVNKIYLFLNHQSKFSYKKWLKKYSFEKMTKETLAIYYRYV